MSYRIFTSMAGKVQFKNVVSKCSKKKNDTRLFRAAFLLRIIAQYVCQVNIIILFSAASPLLQQSELFRESY